MDVTIKQELLRDGTIYIEIRQTVRWNVVFYEVMAMECHGSYCRYPFSDNHYTDLAKAKRQYNALKRRYK